MNRPPNVARLSALYLGVAGATMYAAFWRLSGGPPWHVAALCALPLVLLALYVRGVRQPRERIVRSSACLMFLPLLLTVWAGGQTIEVGPAAEPPALPTLPLQPAALFQGANVHEKSPPVAGIPFRNEVAAFGDNSWLRLMTFASRNEAESYLASLAGGLLASGVVLGGHHGMGSAVAPQVFMYWELHDKAILEVRGVDAAHVEARLLAQHVPPPTPSAQLSPVPATLRLGIGFLLTFGAVHFVLFFVFVLWAGAATTRVARQPLAERVPAATLLARISALPSMGAPCRVTAGEQPNACVVHLVPSAARRSHRLTLRVDEAHAVVRVSEFMGASGAAPMNDDEAWILRDGINDPSALRAQKVWSGSRVTTYIEQDKLAKVAHSYAANAPGISRQQAEALDPDGVIHLTCAVVTASGFDYQPYIFLFQG